MCGISAIAAHQPIASSLLQCLKNLEYRGYDSCGMALFAEGQISCRKNIGNVEEVNAVEQLDKIPGKIGIAHTRWATHGGVTAENSHPHSSNDQNFVIVHNGIFSNHSLLRAELTQKGYEFHSKTDTEVFANQLQESYKELQNVEDAFCDAIQKMEGSFAIAMLCQYEPDKIYAVRKDSPLVIGLSDGANYISSDINAFISETRDTLLINDLEYVIMDKSQVILKDLATRQEVQKQVIQVQWDRETAQRGGFSHYMLKEIFDQPQTIKRALHLPNEEVQTIAQKFIDKQQSFCVGVGTTYYVAMVGSYLFKRYANLYVPAISSDEFPTLVPSSDQQHVLFFSQSGETYDSRMAIRSAKEQGSATSAIVNVVGSSISRMVDDCIFQGSGPEICVVSTKAAISQIVLLWRIAMKVGVLSGNLSKEKEADIFQQLLGFADQLERILNEESGFIRQLAAETNHVKSWLFMGKDIYYPVALESALKMKEVTYLHAEGLPAGFLKHGTLAMVDESLYSLFFLPHPSEKSLYQSTLMAMEEVKARNGVVITFTTEDNLEAQEIADHYIMVPDLGPEIHPLGQLIMAQLFSYYSALHLGLNIDKPRNLAKSVTVG